MPKKQKQPAPPPPATPANPRRILILTADAGFGHRSAANAAAAALAEAYGEACKVDIVNPLEDRRTPFWLRDSQSDYDKLVREMPELYRLGYDASAAPVPSAIVESGLTVLLFEVMYDLLEQYRPDALLLTFPLYQAPLAAVFAITRRFIPMFTVVTDLVTVHRLWFHREADACLTPNPLVSDLALAYGLRPERVQVTGIPVHPDVVREQRSKAAIRAELGWQPDLPTFLAVGSRRVDRLVDTLEVLNHFGQPLQVVAIAGKDESLYQQMRAIDWHVPVHLYEYVTNMPTLMHAADAVLCKAGGLIVTEALACGLPLMLVDLIPGQETGNAEFVVSHGAGDMARNLLEALQTLAHWMAADRRLLNERAANARRAGKPRAAYDVAEIVWRAAQTGPVTRPAGHIAGRPNLVELLTNFNVRLGNEFIPSRPPKGGSSLPHWLQPPDKSEKDE